MKLLIVCLILLIWTQTPCNGYDINVDLSDFTQYNKTNALIKSDNIPPGTTNINIINIPQKVGFFIIQVHSFLHNVTLSSTSEMESQSFIIGTNVGLVGKGDNVKSTFYVTNSLGNETLKLLLAVIIHEANDPIPGGCNLSFDTLLAPYQLVSYTDDLIIVQSQPPSLKGYRCEINDIKIDVYSRHTDNYLDSDSYFKHLTKMLTVDDIIKETDTKISTVEQFFTHNQLYSAYRGRGQIFALVATFNNKSSAYVPAFTYGCDALNWTKSCSGSEIIPHWDLICAFLLLYGAFLTFYGHQYFRTTLFLNGFSAGVLITYISMAIIDNNISIEGRISFSLFMGLIYGSFWLFLWWSFGIPLLSISLTFVWFAFPLIAIYYEFFANYGICRDNFAFFFTSIVIILISVMLCYACPVKSHIFACAFFGTSAVMTAMSYYFSGNFQYISLNLYRRLTVKDFNKATVDLPFAFIDFVQIFIAFILINMGRTYQGLKQEGKPPFPPARYGTFRQLLGVSETTPLLLQRGATSISS